MKTLKLLEEICFDTNGQSTLEPGDLAAEIIGWIQRQKIFEIGVVSSDFVYRQKSYSHYLVKISSDNNTRWSGHGRAENPHIAFIKAFAEAIERATMQSYYRYVNGTYEGLLQKRFDVLGTLSSVDTRINFPPGIRLHNSNGWAAHSDLRSAFQRAFNEALERHTMQLLYWSNGINFLRPQKKFRERDYSVELSAVDSGFGEYQILVASFSREGCPGRVFGHSSVGSGMEKDWTHPEIEAFQVAEPLKYNSPDTLPVNIIDRIQQEFWFKDIFISPTPGAEKIKVFNCLNLNVLAIDLQKSFGFSFPLYACWVFSDSLMPLYLEGVLAEKDRETFRKQYRYITGYDRALVQTPFI